MNCNFLIVQGCLLIRPKTLIQLTHDYMSYCESALCQFFIKLSLYCIDNGVDTELLKTEKTYEQPAPIRTAVTTFPD